MRHIVPDMQESHVLDMIGVGPLHTSGISAPLFSEISTCKEQFLRPMSPDCKILGSRFSLCPTLSVSTSGQATYRRCLPAN
jgi:hypothetical protein